MKRKECWSISQAEGESRGDAYRSLRVMWSGRRGKGGEVCFAYLMEWSVE